MTETVQEVRDAATAHLAAIHRLCLPESKILVVVVFPAAPAQNWLLGNATVEEAMAGLRYLEQEGKETP